MAKSCAYSKKNQGPAIRAVAPVKSPQTGVNSGKAHPTLGVLSTDSPKNVWKPNAKGRK
jgi:hypothetical protein